LTLLSKSICRKFSRQAYLQKRRDKKIDEIRDEILDHEYIFQDVKLTEAEEKEFRYKKKIYDLVKEHVESADDVAEVSSSILGNIVIILFSLSTAIATQYSVIRVLLYHSLPIMFIYFKVLLGIVSTNYWFALFATYTK
jgi:hypothetical protein